jgi:hypothetical protein
LEVRGERSRLGLLPQAVAGNARREGRRGVKCATSYCQAEAIELPAFSIVPGQAAKDWTQRHYCFGCLWGKAEEKKQQSGKKKGGGR